MKAILKLGTEVDKASLARARMEYGGFFRSFKSDLGVTSQKTARFSQTGRSISGLALKIGVLGSSAIGAGLALKKASEQFAEVELQFKRIKGISGASEGEISGFQNEIKSLSLKFGQTQREVLAGAKNLVMAGLSVDETRKAMDPILKASIATGTSAESLGLYLTNIKEALNIPIEGLSELVDVITKGSTLGNVTVESIGISMSKFASLASNLGVTKEEATAMVASLGDLGFSPEESGTAIKIFLQRLIEKDQDEVLKNLGILLSKDGELRNTIDILEDFFKKLKNKSSLESAKIIQKVFGTEVQAKVQGLINKISTGRLKEVVQELNQARGFTEDAFSEISKSLSFQRGLLNAEIDSFVLSLGEGISESALNLNDSLKNIIQELKSSLSEEDSEALKTMVFDLSNWVSKIASGAASLGSSALNLVGKAWSFFSSTNKLSRKATKDQEISDTELKILKSEFLKKENFNRLKDFVESRSNQGKSGRARWMGIQKPKKIDRDSFRKNIFKAIFFDSQSKKDTFEKSRILEKEAIQSFFTSLPKLNLSDEAKSILLGTNTSSEVKKEVLSIAKKKRIVKGERMMKKESHRPCQEKIRRLEDQIRRLKSEKSVQFRDFQSEIKSLSQSRVKNLIPKEEKNKSRFEGLGDALHGIC